MAIDVYFTFVPETNTLTRGIVLRMDDQPPMSLFTCFESRATSLRRYTELRCSYLGNNPTQLSPHRKHYMDMAHDIVLLKITRLIRDIIGSTHMPQLHDVQKVALYLSMENLRHFDQWHFGKLKLLFPDMKILYFVLEVLSPRPPPQYRATIFDDDNTSGNTIGDSSTTSGNKRKLRKANDSKLFSINEDFRNRVLAAKPQERRLDITNQSHRYRSKTHHATEFRRHFLDFFDRVRVDFERDLAITASGGVRIELALKAELQRRSRMWAFGWRHMRLDYDWKVSSSVL